jgi:hypothetical protein
MGETVRLERGQAGLEFGEGRFGGGGKRGIADLADFAQAKNQGFEFVIIKGERGQGGVLDQGKAKSGLAVDDCAEAAQGVDLAVYSGIS